MPSHQPESRLVETSMKDSSTPTNAATAFQSLGGSETCSRADSSLAAGVTSMPEMSSAPHAHRPAHNHVGGANTMSSSEVETQQGIKSDLLSAASALRSVSAFLLAPYDKTLPEVDAEMVITTCDSILSRLQASGNIDWAGNATALKMRHDMNQRVYPFLSPGLASWDQVSSAYLTTAHIARRVLGHDATAEYLIDDMLEIGMNAEGCDIQCPNTESRTSYMETVRDIAREGVMLLGERSYPGSESEHATRRSAESAYTMFALEQGPVWLPEVDWDSVEPLEALATGMEHLIDGRREPPVNTVVPVKAVQNADKV